MSPEEKERRQAANKKNAQKSTGPKTKKGKAKSSQNAVKHGLYANTIVINSPHLKENKEEYLALVQSIFSDLRPKGALQKHLALKIANCLWRSQRVIAAETTRIEYQLGGFTADEFRRSGRIRYGYDDDTAELEAYVDRQVRLRTGMKSIPDFTWARHIERYEMRLDRQLARAYRLLRQLQRSTAKPTRSKNDETNPIKRPAAANPIDPDDKPDKYPFDLSDIPLADPPPDLENDETNPTLSNAQGDNMLHQK